MCYLDIGKINIQNENIFIMYLYSERIVSFYWTITFPMKMDPGRDDHEVTYVNIILEARAFIRINTFHRDGPLLEVTSARKVS